MRHRLVVTLGVTWDFTILQAFATPGENPTARTPSAQLHPYVTHNGHRHAPSSPVHDCQPSLSIQTARCIKCGVCITSAMQVTVHATEEICASVCVSVMKRSEYFLMTLYMELQTLDNPFTLLCLDWLIRSFHFHCVSQPVRVIRHRKLKLQGVETSCSSE